MPIRIAQIKELVGLTDLDDVTITGATQYDVLQFKSGEWVNQQDVEVLGTGDIKLKAGQKIIFDA